MKTPELQSCMKLITDHAWVALKKIKKPTIYEHTDLVNEGITIYFEAKHTFLQEKNTTFKTFLTRLLRNHFCDIVKKSYIQNKTFANKIQKEDYKKHLQKTLKIENPVNRAHINLLVSELKTNEKEYITRLVLSTCSSLSKKREETRKGLNLSKKNEEKIRIALLTKLRR